MRSRRQRGADFVIYASGGSADPEELYTAFRGKMPSPDAMMAKRGLA